MFTAFKEKMLSLYERSMVKRAFSSDVITTSHHPLAMESRALSIDSKKKVEEEKKRATINSKKKVMAPQEESCGERPSNTKKNLKGRHISRLIENDGPYDALISEINLLDEKSQRNRISCDQEVTVSDKKDQICKQEQQLIQNSIPNSNLEISKIHSEKQEREEPKPIKEFKKPMKMQPNRSNFLKSIPKECSVCRKPVQMSNSFQLACTHRFHKQCSQTMNWSMSYKCRICERAPNRNK